jgi:hypothetical protein
MHGVDVLHQRWTSIVLMQNRGFASHNGHGPRCVGHRNGFGRDAAHRGNGPIHRADGELKTGRVAQNLVVNGLVEIG